ncbi:MAG: hypothetical protein LBS06_00765 [Treponema sp.]|jgi:hypothetical protein|nr:hypothetical protein [Treponema sp.]
MNTHTPSTAPRAGDSAESGKPAAKVFRLSPAILLILFAAIPLRGPLAEAMDWPSAEARMVRNFGWNDGGRPSLGSSFQGGTPVLAAEKGELVFFHREEDTASRLPSPLGAWMALDHEDGLISIYSRYENPEGPPAFKKVERGDPVALPGSSGWSREKGFYFSLFDRRERRWVNPSMIIPTLPDTRPPQILSVQLTNGEGRSFDPSLQKVLGQGSYTVTAAVSDTMLSSGEAPLAPHRIVCSVNGAETGFLNFETLSVRDGVLMVNRNGLVPARRIYAPFPRFEVGELWLTRGQATLEVIAQDITGNSRNAVFRLVVE